MRAPAGAAIVSALVFVATPAHAALFAIGHEFRPTAEQSAGTNPCTASNGVTASLVFRCDEDAPGAGCTNPALGKLYAEWREPDGVLESAPVLVAEGAYSYGIPYSCSDDGTILLILEPGLRVVDRNGVKASQSELCDTSTCYGPFVVGATADGFLIAWPVYRHGLFGRRFDANGVPTSASFLIAPSAGEYIFVAKQALLTPAGDVLLAWIEQGAAGTTVQAAQVGSDGTIDPPITVSEFYYVDLLGELTITAEGSARFIVAWNNEPTQAGWVARRLLWSDNAPTTTSTTTTTLDPDVPNFMPAKEIGTTVVGDDRYTTDPPGLVGDGAGHWFASWLDRVATEWNPLGTTASTSVDDARHWSEPQPFHAEDYPAFRASGVAGDESGVAIAAWARGDGGGLQFRRSTDGGQTWTEPTSLYDSPYLSDDGQNRSLEIGRVAVAPDSTGRWVAAWTESVQNLIPCWDLYPDCVDYETETVLCAIRYSVSPDGGLTWTEAQTLEDGDCWDGSLLTIAGDGNGNWLGAWLRDSDIRAAHSVDGAGHWSPSRTLHSGVVARSFWPDVRPAQLSIAANHDGHWLLAYSTWFAWPYTRARVFVSRSDYAAGEWSTPSEVAPWHDTADGRDLFPSIAAGDDGEFALAWSTHSANSGLDADVVAAFSNDGGATWSLPRTVDAEAKTDPRSDLSPRIVRAGRTWAVIWRTLEPSEQRTIRFARTRGDCGNGTLDATEECDDANLLEGDGCDTSCLFTGCGSQVVTGDEQCDDGNVDDTDDCVDCRLAACGDGFVRAGVEECDDANGVETDACLSDCTLARCGDGFVRPGTESCDDAAADNNGDCLIDCTIAACGDGYLELGTEECDDGNRDKGDECNASCETNPDCGFFNSTGLRVTASDALAVLKGALGIATVCPLRSCDVDRDGSVTAADALRTLRSALGLFAEGCSLPATLVVRMTSSEMLGAVQFNVSYRDAAGHVVARPNGAPACEILVPSDGASMYLDSDHGELRAGIIAVHGFQGPRELIRCQYDSVSGPSLHDFSVTVVDAADLDLSPRHPTLNVAAE